MDDHPDALSTTRVSLVIAVTVVFGAFILAVLEDLLDTIPSRWYSLSVAVFVASVPFAHWLGSKTYKGWPTAFSFVLWKRPRFFVYQTFSWTLYIICLLLVLFHYSTPTRGFGVASAIFGFLGTVFMISSLLSFERPVEKRPRRIVSFQHVIVRRMVLLLNNYMNMLLVVGAGFLACVSEYIHTNYPGKNKVLLLCTAVGSAALFIAAIFSTYGLGGALAHRSGWQFWQPLRGGAKFICFQVISWFIFCFSILLQSIFILCTTFVVDFELFVGTMAIAGVLCVVAEIFMLISVLLFRDEKESVEWFPIIHRIKNLLVVTVLMNLPTVVAALGSLPYLLAPGVTKTQALLYGIFTLGSMTILVVTLSIARAAHYRDGQKGVIRSVYHPKYLIPVVFVGALPAFVTAINYTTPLFAPTIVFTTIWYSYVAVSYHDRPEVSGSRMNSSYIDQQRVGWAEICADYFQPRIIRAGKALDKEETYVMSFHPHGILPLTVMWLQLCQQWKKLFPGIYACPLAASAVHQVPLMRDIIQIYGSREVSRHAFESALVNKQSVILVPGGQAEMIESRSGQKQVRLYIGHKGFLRLAMQHGATVVPVLSFSEGELLDNIRAPRLQKWFIKNFAVPFPHFPYGRYFCPIPRRVPLTIVVGEPMKLKKIRAPSIQEISVLHMKYYASLKDLFERYKDEAGCKDYNLVLIEK